MRKIHPKDFKKFDRMSLPFLKHLDGFFKELDLPVCLAGEDPDFRKDKGVHGMGLAIHFRILNKDKTYNQTIKVLNACNEYFKNQNKMRYRLGVYPKDDKPFFHLDILQETYFWIGILEGNKMIYKVCRDEPTFLNELDFLEDL